MVNTSSCSFCDGAGEVYADDPRDVTDCDACDGRGEIARCDGCGAPFEDGCCECDGPAPVVYEAEAAE